jgi:hypothetical protein
MGWSDVARLPVWIRVRRPHRLAIAAALRNLKGGPGFAPPKNSRLLPARSVLSDPALDALCERAPAPAGAFFTDRTPAFLRWRYADGPIAYHVLVIKRPGGAVGDAPAAIVIVRLRKRGNLREVDVCDVIAGPGEPERRAIEACIRGVASEADADHAVGHFGAAWPWGTVLPKAGFRRLPRSGVRFTVRPLGTGDGRPPSPLVPGSWGLAPGDLELF